VLARVDPRMRTRLAGLGIATSMLGVWFALAFAVILDEERKLPKVKDDVRAGRRFAREVRRSLPIMARAMREYVQRDFHPEKGLAQELAVRALAEAGVPA
jgi:hypothetical protein